MEEYNVKCAKCGYIFFDDSDSESCLCPLCNSETDRKTAESAFSEIEKGFENKQKRSTRRMILDMVVFGCSFAAFILIMYFIISFIVSVGK